MKYLLHHNFTWEEEGRLSRSYQHHVSTYMSEVGLVKTEEVDPLVKVESSSDGSRKFVVHSNVSRLSYCENGQDVDVETFDGEILGNSDVVGVGSSGEKTVTIAPSREHDYCSFICVYLEPQQSEYSCVLCGKQFPSKLSFRNHMKTHPKPHQCTECDRSFSSKSHLKQHGLTHTGERPFACMFCTKTFKRKDSCIKHTRTHTGEKPFKCTDCEKSFISRSHWAHHRKSVHIDK